MFFKNSDKRERLYNREFPWLWAICSDWMGIGVKVSNFEDKIFDYWLPYSRADENKGTCYFHIRDAVIKIQMTDNHQLTILHACRRFYALHSPQEVLHIAVVIKGEGVRIYRPAKSTTIDNLYIQRCRLEKHRVP